MNNVQDILALLEEQLPPFFPRSMVEQVTYGLIKPKTLANRDSLGTGPKGRFMKGKAVWYTKGEFLKFLENVISDCKE